MVLTLVAYCRIVGAEFLRADDHENIIENSLVCPPSFSGLKEIWTSAYFAQYVPLSYTLWTAEAWLTQHQDSQGAVAYNPRLFHAVNLFLHGACAVLVFVILRMLVKVDIAAFLGAMLFALHPLQVETVAWISETRSTLAGVFSLAAIYQYLRSAGIGDRDVPSGVQAAMNGGSQTRRGVAWPHYLLAMGFYGLALLSKAAAVSVPLIIVAIDLLWVRRSLWRSLALFAWWCLPALAITWILSSAQADMIRAYVYVPPWWERPVVALDALTFYFSKLLLPVGLTLYEHTPQMVLSSPWTVLTALVPIAVTVVLALLPDRRAWLASAGIFVAVVLPTSGLMPRMAQYATTVADHYVYLGLLGPALALACVMAKPRFRLFAVEVALVLLVLGLLTLRQTGYWRNDRALAERILSMSPQDAQAILLLAAVHWREGDLETAEALFVQAADIAPHLPVTWEGNSLQMWGQSTILVQLANFYAATNRDDEAVAVLERAISEADYDLGPRLLLAKALVRLGRHDRALDETSKLLTIAPDLPDTHCCRAMALWGLTRFPEAIDELHKAVRIEPEDADIRLQLGWALLYMGDLPAAREQLQIVIRLRPDDSATRDLLAHVESNEPARRPPEDQP